MNVINIEIPVKNRRVSIVPRVALIRESDQALCDSLTDNLRILGIQNVLHCAQAAPDAIMHDVLRDTHRAGVLVTGMRDAVVGPVEVSDLRRNLPGWVIIVVDHIDTAHSSADALAAGADDVLRVPFSAQELEARVALRMRQAGMAETSTALKAPLVAGAQLTPVETDIMRILMSQQLDKSEWHYGDRKFDVHITRIRKKLKAAFGDRYHVRTIRSKGYLFDFSEDGVRA